MIPRPARYLLRIDDLCPTINREPWQKIAALIREFGLRPILSVVPDNRDSDLSVSPADLTFWDQMCAMQSTGATIALHGYQHLAFSRGRSLVPIHRRSEFAGAPALSQRTWIRAGLTIMRSHGLNPKLWVAPRHGFDRITLDALRSEGITTLSDGFARAPFVRSGFIWIPQQLWGPAEKYAGLWTICIHPNTIKPEQMDELAGLIRSHRDQFISVEEALVSFKPKCLSLTERIGEMLMLARFAASRFKRRLLLRPSPIREPRQLRRS